MRRELVELGVAEAARRIGEGRLLPVDLLEACLERIRVLDPALSAWVHLDEAGARAAAKERASEAARGRRRGALHGIPVGVKDIFHVAGMPTTAGAGPFAHERPSRDSTAVARLREAGAVIVGKTATTEFAHRDPAATRNPWNLEHTPGGSSSGSAAAVAVRMVPLALGTQTVGSVLRPAAYCGVVGLKPSYGRIPTEGVIPLSWSLDHVGCFARSVEDAAVTFGVLADGGEVLRAWAPRIGLPSAWVERAEPEMAAHISAIARRLAEAGAEVTDTALPDSLAAIDAAGREVMAAEAAVYHVDRFGPDQCRHRPGIATLIRTGLAQPAVDYVRAHRARDAFRADMRPLFGRFTVLLTPAAPGPAPRGLHGTGDPLFCAPWSFIGTPSIALPSGVGGDGLPLAIQLIAGPGRDADLLGAAAWCERVLDFRAAPPR
jgi:aspartyl-tRNA(Asn)/glutamyl-tRNA(Gln) amidotransferase subunit A